MENKGARGERQTYYNATWAMQLVRFQARRIFNAILMPKSPEEFVLDGTRPHKMAIQ
jgi:hypothetical protein